MSQNSLTHFSLKRSSTFRDRPVQKSFRKLLEKRLFLEWGGNRLSDQGVRRELGDLAPNAARTARLCSEALPARSPSCSVPGRKALALVAERAATSGLFQLGLRWAEIAILPLTSTSRRTGSERGSLESLLPPETSQMDASNEKLFSHRMKTGPGTSLSFRKASRV